MQSSCPCAPHRQGAAIYHIRNFAQRCAGCLCVLLVPVGVCRPGLWGGRLDDSTTRHCCRAPTGINAASISSRVRALAFECNNVVDDHISSVHLVAKCSPLTFAVWCLRCHHPDSIYFSIFDDLMFAKLSAAYASEILHRSGAQFDGHIRGRRRATTTTTRLLHIKQLNDYH